MAMNKVIGIIAIFFAALGRAAAAGAQAKPLSGGDVERIYTRLREQIARIPIYDNHSHATFPDDADMDAMAAPPGESSVLRLRDDNPEFVAAAKRSEEHTSELQSRGHLVCRLLLEKKNSLFPAQ